MYIYHFWALCVHCKKTTTIRCFLGATYDLLVVLRKPWICTLCFDALFSKFRDFWWFWTIFNRKMDILDPFWGPQTASCPKVTIYLPLTQGPSQDLLKTLLFWPNFHHFGTPFEGPGRRLRLDPVQAAFGLEDLFGPSKTHARTLKFWSFWPLFLLKKSILVILPIKGQWKCHFDLFWPQIGSKPGLLTALPQNMRKHTLCPADQGKDPTSQTAAGVQKQVQPGPGGGKRRNLRNCKF